MPQTLQTKRLQALAAEVGTNNRERECRGPLHEKITEFLPDFVDPGEKVANLRRISMVFGITYQGVHKWMRPGRKNRITPFVAETLVELSRLTDRSKAPLDWRPAEIKDFWEFMSS
jgi:hypothetical protein